MLYFIIALKRLAIVSIYITLLAVIVSFYFRNGAAIVSIATR